MEEKPRRRWFRFGLRTLFVVMTVVAIAAGLWRRRCEFRRVAFAHFIRQGELNIAGSPCHVSDPKDYPAFWARYERKIAYHELMRQKYYAASKRPWLPVEPDPPEPTPQ